MKSDVKRIYVEKKPNFNVEAKNLFNDIKITLNIKNLKGLRILNRYDVSGISEEELNKAKNTIFSEPTVDFVYNEDLKFSSQDRVFAVEYLPGQYDQRADSAAQCMQILTQGNRPNIASSKVYILEGNLKDEEFNKIKSYCINPVDSREAILEKPKTLDMEFDTPNSVKVLKDFNNYSLDKLKEFIELEGLAMSLEDLKFCQDYFKNTEKRNPTVTEIKVIDTYWSDHCRHTTFMTCIQDVDIENSLYTEPIKNAYQEYLSSREFVYTDKQKDICLMDIATLSMKELRKKGLLDDLDKSDEINACSIEIDAKINGKDEKWLVMFKNETHNHPTEIEPFGGAATCLGGAIRDPLSGRSYVYQAMRVTGSGDPRTNIEDTLEGKLPQRKITMEAAQGYSSYGNQIGLATGQVSEIYDEDYIAKRMEVGAVIAAAPKENVVREKPVEGDIVILVGGRTGRDGCGGATGSSKEHDEKSIFTCGSEVQKGNPPTERKIQRLFRNSEVSKMIKRCNDFGAGGVSVAIGELTDGLDINLDLVPKKYEGLDGTELAISESQERMAVVISMNNADKFIEFAKKENLEATIVAKVTNTNRLKMNWKGNSIVNISRDFLNTNGVKQFTSIKVKSPKESSYFHNTSIENLKNYWLKNLKDLNVCSKRGLVERFDSTIGAGTVIMPFGGKYQLTPEEGMVAKLPIESGDTKTGTIMTYGFNPIIAKWSPFHGALYAVLESITKVVALGGNYKNIRLSLQEYFEKLGQDSTKWGKPFAALLGAFYVQKKFNIPAIGGKDSMSGTFKDMNVPPTLVSFAVNVVDVTKVVSCEFKNENSKVILIPSIIGKDGLPNLDLLKKNFDKINKLIEDKKVKSASSVGFGGIAATISKMAFGNKIGIKLEKEIAQEELFVPKYGSIIIEVDKDLNLNEYFENKDFKLLGYTQIEESICINDVKISIEEAIKAWEEPLENIFATKAEEPKGNIITDIFSKKDFKIASIKVPKPRVLIPVFPGTNCEYDSKKAFEKAGAEANILVFRNLSALDIENSISELVKEIKKSQIIMIPGGFSAGDEPEGSGKFIATVFRNPKIKEAVMEFLNNKDGLMLGICNGFQALIKLGLLPFGEIRDIEEDYPTLTYNNIGRHVSKMVHTKVISNKSPWFSNVTLGETYTVPISHGEGRFVASEDLINKLMKNGQIATQYVDVHGNPSYNIEFNPNGSISAVEAITSPDGRILGKMAHSERAGENVHINIPGNKEQKIFESGVNYFR
ncbi:phosphoribosylformylglycinamidine synthase [Clostridium acetireducens DSM 10703]|uniref:Phosphoribosylformylglycinamidine synthase n=1 Tax=Clostridium acetireducens DSM 10703 TaxID=1121290 RepID=A0A1E8EVQ6_9CLOT|nr:phosphoribosylformylglycinamidine synthase [Clostridium acetireducens]OFI01329.1 phosphoribosylformylglycinamidine synthase [Clostridium acetireducens DSM 10703]